MPAYHQMGHDSRNLLEDTNIAKDYVGAILSPVNYDEESMKSIIDGVRKTREDYDFIFDPQLYFPRSNRGKLPSWYTFSNELDTTDTISNTWWSDVNKRLIEIVWGLSVKSVCSPAIVPRVFGNDDYYSLSVEVASELIRNLDIDVYQTVIVDLNDIAQKKRSHQIASVVTKTKAKKIFLTFNSNITPRREIGDTEALAGAMKLIHLLESAGYPVLVGFSSSDVALWKAAGATSCATGKFFNLRRFTKSRFEEPQGGGGQLPYWFEESIFAFCRESDVIRLESAGYISEVSKYNPMYETIFKCIHSKVKEAWLGHSWRQYLSWFSDFEHRVTLHPELIAQQLKDAEENWLKIEDEETVLMEEPRNNGSWLRPWRRALKEFKDF